MNDTARTKYNYTVQVPYLNMALQELQEVFELNEVPVTQETSVVLPIDAGITEIEFEPAIVVPGTTYLPNDLIEPQILWERNRDIDPYTMMSRVDFLPLSQEGIEINQFIYYVWETQKIKLLASNTDNDIKMNYTRDLFAPATSETSTINTINAATFLEYRTAGLLAEFIDQNLTRAQGLNGYAAAGIDRATGITTKGRQAIMTRRRPFRRGYKRLRYS
jgi:hypothetical protein